MLAFPSNFPYLAGLLPGHSLGSRTPADRRQLETKWLHFDPIRRRRPPRVRHTWQSGRADHIILTYIIKHHMHLSHQMTDLS